VWPFAARLYLAAFFGAARSLLTSVVPQTVGTDKSHSPLSG
jgi:hypothetical protein